MSMLVIVPSRGRPENAIRLAKAFEDTCAFADLLIRTDDDEPEYRGLPEWVRYERGPRLRLGPTLNEVAVREAAHYDVLAFMGDDMVPRADNWDMDLADAAEGGVAYGNDLLQGERLATQWFVDAEVIAKVGYMCPPGMVHMYCDNAIMDLGRGIGRLTYLDDVVIEHLHPFAGKADMDASYEETNAPEQYASDLAVYEAWKLKGLPAAISAVLDVPSEENGVSA